VLAPLLLALCRFGQGFGLGGEWGGAVLLATENSPPGKSNWYGSFPQYGAPIGFIISSGIFLLLTRALSDQQFMQWGWRVPFIASSVLVLVGLWVRLRIEETRDFRLALQNRERVAVPLAEVFRNHGLTVVLGTLGSVAIFAVFYLLTVFALGWATGTLGYSRQEFLVLQIIGMVFFGAGIPVSAMLADRFNPRLVLMVVAAGTAVYGLVFAALLGSSSHVSALLCLALGGALIGLAYGPLGSMLASLFPTAVRYTGASITFNLTGIIGGSLTPYVATWLATRYGLPAVGWYLSFTCVVTALALLLLGRLRASPGKPG
jgi:MFS family permease